MAALPVRFPAAYENVTDCMLLVNPCEFLSFRLDINYCLVFDAKLYVYYELLLLLLKLALVLFGRPSIITASFMALFFLPLLLLLLLLVLVISTYSKL